MPAVRDWCIRQSGFTFRDLMESPEKYVFSQYYCVKEFKYDAVWDLSAIHGESEALGSKLLIADDMPPSVIEPIAQDYSKDCPAFGFQILTKMEGFLNCWPLSAG